MLCGTVALVACVDRDSTPASAPGSSTSASAHLTRSEEERDFESFFWPDTADERAYRSGLESRIAGCMKARGFDYPNVPAGAEGETQPSPDTPPTELDFGLVDSMLNGGETPTDARLSVLLAFIDALPDREGQRYEIALWGDPADESSTANSCTSKANDEMTSSIPRFQAQYQRILDDYYSRLRSDSRVTTATADWAGCLEEATGLLRATGSPLILSRSNVVLAVHADLAVRLGKSIRWLAAAEVEQLDTSSLVQPEVSVDEAGVGLLVHGAASRVDAASVDSARTREQQIASASERCWVVSGGAAAVAELQADAMNEAETLIAASVSPDQP